MIDDYYAILRVSPTATAKEIKTAYKRRAVECHPDRGGSHAEMVKVNLAYEILSDSETRQRFDASREAASTERARHAAEADVKEATSKAENYPQKWADFEKWMKSFSRDFANAKYGTASCSEMIPTVSGSVSGVLFIVVGGLIGIVGAIAVATFGIYQPKAWLAVIAICAHLGVGAHQLLGKVAKKFTPVESESATSEQEIVACEKCGQKLRLPSDATKLKVTCPTCRFQFEH